MKVMKSVLLALALVSPAAMVVSVPAAQAATQQDVAEYADAFAGAARQALVALQAKSSADSDVRTGITQARIIQIGALELGNLVDANASDEELAAKLLDLETHVYQLDAIKRRLQTKYKDNDLTSKLTYVRTLYLNLKVMLTGEEV